MKFTNGFWLMRPDIAPDYAAEYWDHTFENGILTVFAATRPIGHRGDTLNSALLTVTFTAPMDGAVGVTLDHHRGIRPREPVFEKEPVPGARPSFEDRGDTLVFTSGRLSVYIDKTPGRWKISFMDGGVLLTESSYRNMAHMKNRNTGQSHMVEQLALSVGENIYGLGERFTPFVKNGQIVDIWNEDGGTASEIAYKNIPFYLSGRGYGVFVDTPTNVSFEVGSEKVSRVQFSVEGQRLGYIVFAGPTPREALSRYTALLGKPALPPAWTFGLWLTTSFTTSYDEETVTSFIQGMADRDIPLHVFHFDSFWMKGYEWISLEWNDDVFPDPAGMLARLKARGLHICVWINPYVAQKSPLFDEGLARGYLLRTSEGDVWQTDMWQAGMALVDFTNPDAAAWYREKLKALLDMGVDSFKTDFGERIPSENVVWHDGSDPARMHNYYTYLYNKTVFSLLEEERGQGDACVFARSATAGGQKFPVHWGGDSSASFPSMAESLRGGLSLAVCGFGFWSHDIGGFEQTASADVYKRWCAFGLLSTHSRLHGSTSYRVPWLFDDEACDVLRTFVKLKCRLMPYLFSQAVAAHRDGVPVMRPMVFEFPDDPACRPLDTQYMLGGSLLAAPVFREDGVVEYYLPDGRWTNYLTGEVVDGGHWRRETHDYFSLPLMVKPDTVLVTGARDDRPDYEYEKGMTVELFELADGCRHSMEILRTDGMAACMAEVVRQGSKITVSLDRAVDEWFVLLHGPEAARIDGGVCEADGRRVRACGKQVILTL